MFQDKLKEMRGEEPAFLPGHVEESWRRIEFGVGASSPSSSPETQASLPPRRFPWVRVLGYAFLSAALIGMAVWMLLRMTPLH